jgi:hypothetical protein
VNSLLIRHILDRTRQLKRARCGLNTNVADPHHFDPDPDPDPAFNFDVDLRILPYILMRIRIRILPFHLTRIQIRILLKVPFTFPPDLDPPMLKNDPRRFTPFYLDADPDPDPAFHFDVDPVLDPA